MFKVVYRYIVSSKKSSIAAVLGIVISTMLMFSMIQISDCFMLSFRSFVNSNSPQDFYVVDLSYDELTAIDKEFKDMGAMSPDRYLSTMLVGKIFEDDSQVSTIIGFEGDLGYFKKTSLISGNYPASENEICIEESYAESHPELKVNDELELNINLTGDDKENSTEISTTFKISGIIKDVIDDGSLFYTNLETAKKIFDENNIDDNRSNAITVEAEEGSMNEEKILEAREAIQAIVVNSDEDFKYYNQEQYYENEDKALNYGEKGSFESVSFAVFMLSLIIAVCLTIFVYNAISLSFVRKINVFETMRCIGLSNRHLSRMILLEQFILITIGSVIGMVLGALLNIMVADKIMSMLISTAVNMQVEQNIRTYIVTYLLALLSALVACLKLIRKIRRMNPINIKLFNTAKKSFSVKNTKLKAKNYLFNLALRSLKRNFSKSIIQTVTLIVSFLLCLIICNVFAVIDINKHEGAVDFSDYYIQSEIAFDSPFTEEDLHMLESMDGIDKIYTEECLTDYEWSEKSPLQVMLYDDDLLKQFAKINNISYDSSKPFSALITDVENTDDVIQIKHALYQEEYELSPIKLENACHLSYAVFTNSNILIINEKTAEQLDYQKGNYCTFLVDTDKKLSELMDIDFSTDKVYVTNLHDGKSDAEAQLLGLVIISVYIVVATVFLSFIIISNTIKENLKSKEAEYGVMRAMGLNCNRLCVVSCYENFIMTLTACMISVPISLIINAYITYNMLDKVKISVLAYLVLILLFTGLIELFAYLNIRSNTKKSIVEMLYER